VKRIWAIFCILFALAVSQARYAQALDVDWKYYGGHWVGGLRYCFYEANSVVRTAGDHIRVWVKCLLHKDLEIIDIKRDFGGKIFQSTAEKMAKHYIPPFGTVEPSLDVDEIAEIVKYEEIANTAYPEPQASIFYELNCPERMLRELSISLQRNRRDIPGNWKYVPPEGNDATFRRQ
jgi:hypothetical protein